jgi:hypothetical protein
LLLIVIPTTAGSLSRDPPLILQPSFINSLSLALKSPPLLICCGNQRFPQGSNSLLGCSSWTV